jgi:sialic acid synthase SpsE
MSQFNIGRLIVGDGAPPLVIAEIGANHDGSFRKAEDTVNKVAAAGVKAVKFQFYTANELAADQSRVVNWGPPGNTRAETVGAMFNRLSLSLEEMKELFSLADQLNMEAFATPFSEQGADQLAAIGVSCFKIASSDVTHLPMLRHVARLNRPVILSLGKCTLAEADIAIDCLMANGCKNLAILHCVATYPSPMHEMNLRVIPTLKSIYPELVIGFSDHSLGVTAAVAATALGARIIEKHVTLNKADPGPDHWFSLDMDELYELVKAVSDVDIAMGHPRKRVLECEQQGREKATRSLVAAVDLKTGTVLQPQDIKIVRPGNGISPMHYEIVIGMKLSKDITANTPIMWKDLKP